MLTLIQFLSTLSLRRATAPPYNLMIQHTNFYPRSPCGERRPASHLSKFNTSYFYPRSPCGERLVHALKFADFMLFLSTLSLRRATQGLQVRACQSEISIHALLAESDQKWPKHQTQTQNFYPRSPCGERRNTTKLEYNPIEFLSTLSLRRATSIVVYPMCFLEFLSTLSLRRATDQLRFASCA